MVPALKYRVRSVFSHLLLSRSKGTRVRALVLFASDLFTVEGDHGTRQVFIQVTQATRPGPLPDIM